MGKIVAIGGSQGGVTALRSLIGALPRDFPAPILVVQHIGASPSILPSILNDLGILAAQFGTEAEPLLPGHVYIAPPDHHMLVNNERLELTRGPRENWARPAIDPLFRSVAEQYGPAAIAVLLSGRLNDGTAGIYEIKRRGGTAIVQTPAEAEAPDMPQSALDNVSIDFCLPISEMARLLLRLAAETEERRPIPIGRHAMEQQKIIRPSAQTCPECGGAMREDAVGNLTRFRCHIGHVMTAEILASTQLEVLEQDLSSILRRLNERVDLCRDIAEKHAANGNERAAEIWRRAGSEAGRREKAAKAFVDADWVHTETAEIAEAGE